MEPQPSMTGTMASQKKWAKPEDWERLRNTISALWMLHSLPVVMRVMREEHDFHATPKMFQAQLYQKWGLRKSRPESRANKKRRRSLEEAESIASSSYLPATTQEGGSTVLSEDLSFTPQTNIVPERAVTGSDAGGPIPIIAPHGTGIPLPSLPTHLRPPSYQGGPDYSMELSDASMLPSAWNDFIFKSQSPRLLSGQSQGAISSAMAESLPDEQEDSFDGSANPSVTGSGAWMSTVLMETPPSVAATSNSRGSSSGRSRMSRSSGVTRKSGVSSRSRTSHASSSCGTLLSSSSRSSALSANQSFGLSLASLRHLEAPEALLLSEKSLFYARHYISSTFSTGLWTLSQTADSSLLNTACIKLDRWYNDFNPGMDQLGKKEVTKAFSIFQPCFAAAEGIIAMQDPRLVIYICQQAIRFMFYDQLGRSLSRILFKYTVGCCKKLFGVHHPLYILLAQLAQMDYFELARNIGTLMECYFEHLEPFLDPESESLGFLLELRGLTVGLMEATGMMGFFEAKRILDQQIQRSDSLGFSNLHIKIEVAAALQRNRYFDEAKASLLKLIRSEEAKQHPYEYVYACFILVITLERSKDIDGAIRAAYELVDFLMESRNRTESAFNDELYKSQVHSSLATAFSKLEHMLRGAGRTDEADQIHARLEASIDRDYAISEPTEESKAAEDVLNLENMK
ncbi:uncharacterized protein BCR38DRAFT_405828 [Pseudomassariella vexata]|uniref:Clr5 domain-containing protein n=1 Tax=Pseudomassariella vexata TaxID=1141098 RepID=A0A1Y2EF43_9PEZI|nr:uncharacterized protein BCR38DRAFT_405828 [Pseudomassariella vexata]ORY70198.1 hypothetical protein BCR38DRAFT_405828 [Pseudomassariella vexata]